MVTQLIIAKQKWIEDCFTQHNNKKKKDFLKS